MKLKTHQTTAKKIKLTNPKKGRKEKKFLTKKSGQDHFNARESGKITKNKRRLKPLFKTDQRNIKRLLPYS